MNQKLLVPDIGDFEKVEVIEILVKPGDNVNINDPIVTIESDKSSVEIPSTIKGKVISLNIKIGDKVSKGDLLLNISSSEKISLEKTIPKDTENIISEAEEVVKKKDENLTKKNIKELPEKKETIIEIEIPAGVEEGMQLSMQGKGNEAPGGGAAGDLIIAIEEIEHEHLVRNGTDLLYQLGITFSDAVIGKTIEIPMVSGKAKIKIPSGTQSGKNLRLRSKGIPDVNGYGRGDMIVNIQVFTPQKISKEEKELLLKLNESDNFKPKLNQTKNFFDRMKNRFA